MTEDTRLTDSIDTAGNGVAADRDEASTQVEPDAANAETDTADTDTAVTDAAAPDSADEDLDDLDDLDFDLEDIEDKIAPLAL